MRQSSCRSAAVAGALLAAVSHLAEATSFVDVSAAVGVDALHHARYLVTGQAWGDVDGDGRLDLYVTDSAGPITLLLGQEDGTFSPSPHTASVALPATESGGAAFIDYDNDGWSDLYVLNRGPNALFRNEGGQGFTDVAASAGVAELGQGESAAWGDYDGPGCGHWCFTDVSVSSGAHRPVCGMGIATGDYDGDGDLDFYFSSIAEQVLLQNQAAQGSPTFVEATAAAGVNVDGIGWGMVFFD